MVGPLQTIEKYYTEKNAQAGPTQSLVFKDNTVTLDIPKDGIDTEDGWKLKPATPPTVSGKLCTFLLPSPPVNFDSTTRLRRRRLTTIDLRARRCLTVSW